MPSWFAGSSELVVTPNAPWRRPESFKDFALCAWRWRRCCEHGRWKARNRGRAATDETCIAAPR